MYFKEEDGIKHRNRIAISECLKTWYYSSLPCSVTFYTISNQEVDNVMKIIYFSYGLSLQYKNRKNFVKTNCRENDFSIAAAWLFFATSHGKGPCDGIGSRLVMRTSLQSLQDSITTPKKLFDWAVENVGNISLEFFKMEDYKKEFEPLKEWHEKLNQFVEL